MSDEIDEAEQALEPKNKGGRPRNDELPARIDAMTLDTQARLQRLVNKAAKLLEQKIDEIKPAQLPLALAILYDKAQVAKPMPKVTVNVNVTDRSKLLDKLLGARREKVVKEEKPGKNVSTHADALVHNQSVIYSEPHPNKFGHVSASAPVIEVDLSPPTPSKPAPECGL